MQSSWIVIIIFITCLASVSAQNRGIEILSHKEEVFVNKNCKKTKVCDLKRVEYFIEDYKVSLDQGYNYGTRFFARYVTKSVKSLEKYVFAQFIKGCDFSSELINGQVIVSYDTIYLREDETVKFKFFDWVLDSYDHDPVYSTLPGKSRFFGYRWNTVPGSFSTDTEKLYGQVRPKTPKLYIVDHPGSAFYADGSAKNISLQFKTCIYKTKDVPTDVAYNNINFAEPISCHEWNSSFIFNHLTDKFESPSYIVPACQ